MQHRRREFPASVKRAAFARSHGTCECHRVRHLPTYRIGCGVKLADGNCFYEHIDPDNLGGDPTLDNCAALCRTCWRIKTATYDLPEIARLNRQRDAARGIKRDWYPPIAGTKRSGIKKPMRPFSRPIDRSTGKEL